MALHLLPLPSRPCAKVISLCGPTMQEDVTHHLRTMYAGLVREYGTLSAQRMMAQAFMTAAAGQAFDSGRAIAWRFALEVEMQNAWTAEGTRRALPTDGSAA